MVTLDQAGRNRAQVRLVHPDVGLMSVVEHVWIDEHADLAARPREWRIVPDSAPHVIWHVLWRRDRLVGQLHLVGAREMYCDIDASPRILTIGARLRPGMLPTLFRLPAHVLTDRAVALADVLDTRSLEQQLWNASPRDAADILGRFLLARSASSPPTARRTRALVASLAGAPDTPVAAAATTLGVSTRHVLELSHHQLGMSAKRFARITRLHRALSLGLAGDRPRWSVAAATAGYADQSHFIRECRALLGETPNAFVSRRGLQRPPDSE